MTEFENLSHEELIKIAILEIIEDKSDILTKEEKDSLILLFIESDVLEE